MSDPEILSDDFQGYAVDSFSITPCYECFIKSVLIPQSAVTKRMEKMAADIVTSLEKKKAPSLYLVCVLKGGFNFASDLSKLLASAVSARKLSLPIHMEFVVASTYLNDRVDHDTKLTVCTDPNTFKNQHVVIAEDLIDTGTTMRKLVSELKSFNAESVEVACLCVKRRPDCTPFVPDYVGFEVTDTFIVGYGIDYNEHFRDIPHICSVNDQGKRHFAVTG